MEQKQRFVHFLRPTYQPGSPQRLAIGHRLESERSRLLNCLREVNEDRDKVKL